MGLLEKEYMIKPRRGFDVVWTMKTILMKKGEAKEEDFRNHYLIATSGQDYEIALVGSVQFMVVMFGCSEQVA